MPHPKLDAFLHWTQLLAPTLLAVTPGGQRIGPLIPTIVGAIQTVEQMPGATGAEKRAAVLQIVGAAGSILGATGKLNLDPAELQRLTGASLDTVISVINLVHDAHGDPDPRAGSPGILLPPSPTGSLAVAPLPGTPGVPVA